MNKRRLLLSLVLLLSAICAPARIIPAPEALARALSSEKPSAGMRRSPSAGTQYSLAYSAPTGSYHIYNRCGGGYIVVSGDDQIYPLLADVSCGAFTPERLAPAARWLLEGYDAQIRSFAAAGSGANESLADHYNRWTEIAPLMSTQWNQLYPFNKFCPVVGGRTCVTGCVATAMAQVVRHIGYYEGKGYRYQDLVDSDGHRVEFDYAAATFDFPSMFDFYPSAATIESIDQVARLMLACGLGVGMSYSPSGSGAQSDNVARALVENFGFDEQYTRLHDHDNYSQAQWENMLHRQLELGRPVYYSGAGGGGGHAFVIDGYRPAGLYHVNWGWGGLSDGYFRLTALNPDQIGTGGGNGGYNRGQQMVCAVPPGTDPGVIYGEMSGSLTKVGEGVYSLYYKAGGNNQMNVSIGAVIVDADGNTVGEATFWTGQNVTANSAVRSDSYDYDFSRHALGAGDYRIYPAYRPKDGEYIIADAFYNRPYFLHLTVTDDGKYQVSNDQIIEFKTDIHVADLVPGYDLREGFSGNVGFYVVNDGNIDYEGAFRLSLLDDEGQELASETTQRSVIAAGVCAEVYCYVPVFTTGGSLIKAGTYRLRIADEGGNVLSDGALSIEKKKGSPYANWVSDEDIEVTNGATIPAKLLGGELWPHTPFIKTLKTHRNMSLELAFYAPQALSPSAKLVCYEGTIEPRTSAFPLEPLAADVPFGTYEVCYRKGYSQISQRAMIRIGASADGIGYFPTSGNGASAALTEAAGDREEIVIPAQVSIGGTDRPVTALESEALLAGSALRTVDLPESIERIGLNAFTNCPSLAQIIMRSARPPFAYLTYVATGLRASTEFYVPAPAYDAYKPLLEGHNPLYTLVQAIEPKDTVVSDNVSAVSLSIFPAHEAINPAFIITPADASSASVADIRISSAGGGRLNLEVIGKQPGTATFHIQPPHRSDVDATLTITVLESISTPTPSLDLAAGSYVIGRRLSITSPENTSIIYSVNGGPEVATSSNTVDYRFPAPGEYRVKAKCVSTTGEGNKESDWTDEVCYTITENIIHPEQGNAYYPLTLHQTGVSTFAALQNYVMPIGLRGGIVTADESKGEAFVTYLYEAGDVVPARVALVLSGTAGEKYHLALTDTEGMEPNGNSLLPALTYDRIEASEGTKSYVFTNAPEHEPGFTFQNGCDDGSAVEGIYGEGYLSVATSSDIRRFILKESEPDEDIKITNGTAIPGKLLSGELWPHTPLIETKHTYQDVSLSLAFYSPSATEPSHTLVCYQGAIEPMQSLFPLTPIAVNIPFGTYEVCYLKDNAPISERALIRIGTSGDGLDYYPTSEDEVSVALAKGTGDPEEIIIPEQVNIDGSEYPVTAIEPGAFTTNNALSVVDLPQSIKEIGSNAFASCPSLQQIIMRSERPPFSSLDAIAPGLSTSAEFYVPATAYGAYKSLLETHDAVYTLVETIQSKDVTVSTSSTTVSLAVSPAHEAVNPAFVITPSDVSSASVADVRAASFESGHLHLNIQAKQPGEATFHVRPAHRTNTYAVLTITVKEETPDGITGTASGTPDRNNACIYTVSGMRMGGDVTRLPAGVYIVNGRKVVIK